MATTKASSLAAASAALLLRDAATQSPVTQVHFRGQRVHVKRDDIFHLAGNKLQDTAVDGVHHKRLTPCAMCHCVQQMRKLHWFVTQDDAFYRDAHLVSYGGTQSNAMLAIAQLAHAKRVPFTYYSRGLALRSAAATSATTTATDSNLTHALALGMTHVELLREQYDALVQTQDLDVLTCQSSVPSFRAAATGPFRAAATGPLRPRRRTVFVPQGVACRHAQVGLKTLAHELNTYMGSHDAFAVVVPCGTGTTALYLAQHLAPNAEVFAVPCVGDAPYLRQQLHALATQDATAVPNPNRLTVVTPPSKARFGRLAAPLLAMYDEVQAATGVPLDLNYGAFAWTTMFDPTVLRQLLKSDRHDEQRELLYVHTGGVSGNASMLARYAAKQQRQQQQE